MASDSSASSAIVGGAAGGAFIVYLSIEEKQTLRDGSPSTKRLGGAIDAEMSRPFSLESLKLDYGAKIEDPVVPFDGQSEVAAELQRGVCQAFRALGHSVVTELPLANGRRADVVALSRRGDVLIVEIKSCLLDYRSDAKWQDYLRPALFRGASRVPLRRHPEEVGLILADRYSAELVREGMVERLSAARRKAMMLRFARAAALRL